MKGLVGKRAIVTGGSSGIRQAIAVRLGGGGR
jgi:NAD(P)-dependent dehydrogenase (short-subunit alcohol dehydrogenase family)